MGDGLPEFDAVAFWVDDPGEAAEVVVFTMRVDDDGRGCKLGEKGVQVVDPVVDHGLLGAFFCAGAEVGGVFGEDGPFGSAGVWRDFVGPEEAGAAIGVELEAEVLGVPGGEGFWVFGA